MVALSACGGSHRVITDQAKGPVRTKHGVQISARKVSSSSLILGGRVRCTATVSRSVQAGSALGLNFAVRNISTRPAKVSLTDVWLVVKAADGTTYDTRVPGRNAIGGV